MIHIVPKLRTWDELRRPRSRAALRLVRSVHLPILGWTQNAWLTGRFQTNCSQVQPKDRLRISEPLGIASLFSFARLPFLSSLRHVQFFIPKSLDGFVVGLVLPPPFGYTLLQAISSYTKKKETETVYRSESHHPPSECGHMDRWLPCWTNGSRCHRVCCLQWPECSSIMFYHVQSVSAAKNLLYHPSPAFRAWTNATENGQFRNPSLRVCHARIPPKTLCQGAVTLSTPTGFGSRRVTVSTMSSSANQRTGSWCKIL